MCTRLLCCFLKLSLELLVTQCIITNNSDKHAKGGKEMFEQDFDNMFADVWFDERDCAYAYEEGIGEFDAGANTMHSNDAVIAVRKYDRALRGTHYAGKRNRLRAQRNSLVTAFGPEMVERVGYD